MRLKMRYSSKNSIFPALLFACYFWPAALAAQSRPQVTAIVAKVIDIDKESIFDMDFLRKMSPYNHFRGYYYAILHFKVVSADKDTSIIGYVFDTRTQINEAIKSFGITKDSVYEFWLYKLRPCDSDFPALYGCSYNDSLYTPHVTSIVKKPYREISRILEWVHIYHDLWNQLCESYK